MDEAKALTKMIAPSMKRPTNWLHGVIQIHVTRACDLSCHSCTQGSNLRGKPVVITLEEFEIACKSLRNPDYWGVVGVFGGNPAVHPQFPELCEILKTYVPFKQRGLWCNHPRGHGKLMREVFNPSYSNLNVHLSHEAYDEFKRDWPESRPFGLHEDSRHSPPFVAMKDVESDESKRWDMISNCDINKFWSAMVCSVPGRGLRAFFCEIAGAQAMLHPDWPDTGLPAVEGWWTEPMTSFDQQVRLHCHACGVPLRRFGQLAVGGEYEEVSETHKDIYQPKQKDRLVQLVTSIEGKTLERVTDYVEKVR